MDILHIVKICVYNMFMYMHVCSNMYVQGAFIGIEVYIIQALLWLSCSMCVCVNTMCPKNVLFVFLTLESVHFSSLPPSAEYQSEHRSVVAASSTAVSQLWSCTAYSALSTPTLHFPKQPTGTHTHTQTYALCILALFTTL